MGKEKQGQAKTPRGNAAKNKSSAAGKRSEQQPKAAGEGASSKPAPPKTPAKSAKPAQKARVQTSKSNAGSTPESDIKKIYKTTDGQFTGRSDITKLRNVAVIEQREDDGALALVKIYSKKNKKGKSYINGLVLKPKKHKALTEKSIVGTRVIIGIEIKTKNGKEFKPIFKGDLTPTDDALTERELKKVKRGAGGKTKKNKETLKNKIAKWRKHFK